MRNKYLPIQFFEKRKDYDDRSTESGGDSKTPNWVLTGATLTARSAHLVQEVASVAEAFKQRLKIGSKLPMVVCTTITEKAIAKSHRDDITSIYATRERNNILGFSGEHSLLSIVSNEQVTANMKLILSKDKHRRKAPKLPKKQYRSFSCIFGFFLKRLKMWICLLIMLLWQYKIA